MDRPDPVRARRCDPDFAPLLDDLDLGALERHPGSVYGLWGDLTVAYVNPAWRRFAEENAGAAAIGRAWELGASYLAAVPQPLRPFFRRLFARSRETGAAGLHPVGFDYECSAPRTFRFFHMDVYALRGGEGYVVVNSLVVERSHDAAERPPKEARLGAYRDASGSIRQCSHCRRVQDPAEPERWDWIPDWVDEPPDETSHTICPVCFEYFYPGESGNAAAQ